MGGVGEKPQHHGEISQYIIFEGSDSLFPIYETNIAIKLKSWQDLTISNTDFQAGIHRK